jgi:hypothetical protein
MSNRIIPREPCHRERLLDLSTKTSVRTAPPSLQSLPTPPNGRLSESLDNERVDIHLLSDVNFWSRQLQVPVPDLIDAVREVGPFVKDVKRRLRPPA